MNQNMYLNREDEIKFDVSAVMKVGYFPDFDLKPRAIFRMEIFRDLAQFYI